MEWCELPGSWLGHEVLERYGCRMAQGVWITIQLTGLSVTMGFALALLLAVAQHYGPRWAGWLVTGYTTFFRGTPLLAQLFLVYYGFGQFRLFWQDVGLWWLFREPFYCALLTFTINTAAYQAEILRGALQSVGKGQFEGAYALGLGRWQTLATVIMPQAMIVALRPLGNELITMIKSSSVASLVTLLDLMGATRFAFARSFDLSIYLYAAVLYLMLVETVRRVWGVMERRLTRHIVVR
jgi:polar amino acid transport system permease protein